MQVGDEECEDGNTDNGDGCRDDCTIEECGDGIVDPNELCFLAPTPYPGGPKATLADLDGDNLPDLITVHHFGGNEVRVRLNSMASPGAFGGSTTVGTGRQVKVVNVNGDANVDLVVSNYVDVYTLPGNGNGTFGSPLAAAYLGSDYMLIDVAPMDADAFPDVASAGCRDGGCGSGVSTHILRLNDGGGLWEDPPSDTVSGDLGKDIRLLDVNGNGAFDLVILNGGNIGDDGKIGVYLGNGDGTVQDAIVSAYPSWCLPNSMDFGLVNADAFLDVVVGDQCLNVPVYVLFGDGAGNFSSPLTLTTGVNATFGARFLDVDNDGNLDVVAGTQADDVLFFKGRGDGTFDTVQTLFTVGAGDLFAAGADLNNDGAMDLVVSTATVTPGVDVGVDVYLSNP